MFKFISELQSKPDNYKRKVALFLSVSFTLVIVVVWLSTLLAGGSRVDGDSISVEEASAPIESLRSYSTSALESIKGLF